MDKIILTKKQAKAIEALIGESHLENAIGLTLYKFRKQKKWNREELLSLNELSYEQILQALYVGYEVEEKKKKKLSIYFNDLIDKIGNNEDEDSFYYGYSLGIEKALEILEIEIEGIND